MSKYFKKRDLQDGGGVRREDHLPSHKFIKNTSTCGTTPTEHLLNAGRRLQTSQKARNSPRTWIGQKKKQRQKNRDGTCTSGRELWRRKGFHTLGSPFTGGDRGGGRGGSFRAMEESTATGVRRAKRRDSCTEDQRWPTLTSPRGLSAHPPGRAGLGAEARASEVGSQGEDWGWRCEHSLKGASAPQLARTESRKKSGHAGEERDLRFCTRRGDSFPISSQKAEHCLHELQRWAQATAISSDPRDGHEMLRLLLLPPRSLCASTGHYPHLPSWEPVQPATARVPWSRENTWCTWGCCNITLASAASGSPCIPVMTTVPLPSSSLSEQESCNQPLL